jgi:hypothetical protein
MPVFSAARGDSADAPFSRFEEGDVSFGVSVARDDFEIRDKLLQRIGPSDK